MQPIKTTNAMNPAPAKGIESFPTPVIDDVVIAEVVNSWKGDYQKLEYGTLWKDVSHAPNQGSFPEHKLVYQQPTSEDGQWIKRIWVNDRVNQDSYNYAIKYSAGSQDHPIYIRNYVVPRETYAPLPDGTPDPLFPTAVLVDEEANRIEGELDSKYISVTKVYETLPGPAVPTKRFNERGDLETVSTQTVASGTQPDPDGLLVTQSQVAQEDVSKGVKTTATVDSHSQLLIKEKKEGLLGETITTDDIVDPATDPDNLTTSVIASTVQQVSKTKAVKRTTTASGPTSLTQKSNDGKLLGNVTSIQSIVSPTNNPDAISSNLLSSEVKQIDSGKAIKTNILLNSTPTLSGNQNEGGLLGNKRVVESIVPSGSNADALSQTVISSSVEAIDSARSQKTTISSTGPLSLSGVQNKDGLLGQTQVIESIVSANSPADSVSLQVISSIVEPIDSAKSKKTTIISNGPQSLSGKENKGGLLGNTTTTESIVSINSNPDQLSQTVISSTIQPIDLAKSKKTTITSNGPTSLISRTLADSPTGAVIAVKYNEIVNPNQVPVNSLTTLKYEINAIDSAKSEAEIVTVDAWPEIRGVEFDDSTGIPIPYTEKVIPPSEYNQAWRPFTNTNYKPIDEYKTVRKSYNTQEIQRYFTGYLSVIEKPVQISLPDKLIDVIAYTARDYSEGKNVSNSNNVGGDSYGYSTGGGYKSSGSISADIYFKIEKGFEGYIDGMEVTIFVESSKIVSVAGNQVINNATGEIISGNIPPSTKSVNANVLAELQRRLPNEKIKLWPTLKKISQNILVFTGGKSKTRSFSKSEDVSINGFANSEREDDSYDIDTNVNSVIVPDALYEEITIKEEIFGPLIPADLQITGGVYPKKLPPTNPAKFPIGNYIIKADASIYKFGLVKITATIAKVTEDFV
jgi:hypothetical protein